MAGRWLAAMSLVALLAAGCATSSDPIAVPRSEPAVTAAAGDDGTGESENEASPRPPVATATETPTPAPSETPAPTPTPGPPPPPDLSKPLSVFFAPVPPKPPGSSLPTPDGAVDFMELFEPGAPWQDAAGHMDGFKIHSWMIRHYFSDDDLVAIYTGLRDRGIPLIIEAEPLDPPDPAECDHTESFEGPYEIENLQRLKDLEIEVAMIAIEQPFSFGHRLRGPGACQYELSRVVDEVVAWVADARSIYPEVEVGSIEAIWSDPVTSPEDFEQWLDAYREASGEPFAFINVDPNYLWTEWGEVALGVEAVADERGIPFGLLYNGNVSTTNEEYLQQIAELFAYYEGELGGTPNQVWIQSWHALPDRLLPDDDPGAMTSLVNQYFGARAEVVDSGVEVAADGVPAAVGTLFAADGRVLPGRTIEVQALPIDAIRQSATVSGTVPSNATTALVAVRVNAENADPGDTSMTVFSLDYREGGGAPNLVPNGDFASGLASWGVYGEPLGRATTTSTPDGPALGLQASADEQIWIDGAQFAVTPNVEFDFTAEFAAPSGTDGTVTVAVIFLDVDETSRSTIVLGPRPISQGWTGQTDDLGNYRVSLDGLASGSYELAIRTDGDPSTWPASTTSVVEVP